MTNVSDSSDQGREKPYDLEERIALFGEAVLDCLKNVPVTPVTRRLIDQAASNLFENLPRIRSIRLGFRIFQRKMIQKKRACWVRREGLPPSPRLRRTSRPFAPYNFKGFVGRERLSLRDLPAVFNRSVADEICVSPSFLVMSRRICICLIHSFLRMKNSYPKSAFWSSLNPRTSMSLS